MLSYLQTLTWCGLISVTPVHECVFAGDKERAGGRVCSQSCFLWEIAVLITPGLGEEWKRSTCPSFLLIKASNRNVVPVVFIKLSNLLNTTSCTRPHSKYLFYSKCVLSKEMALFLIRKINLLYRISLKTFAKLFVI